MAIESLSLEEETSRTNNSVGRLQRQSYYPNLNDLARGPPNLAQFSDSMRAPGPQHLRLQALNLSGTPADRDVELLLPAPLS